MQLKVLPASRFNKYKVKVIPNKSVRNRSLMMQNDFARCAFMLKISTRKRATKFNQISYIL